MFLQASATVNWCSNAAPETLVSIGPDAMGMLSDNIVVCYNLKNASKAYFKADNPQVCAGISILTGHRRYPLFAVVEAVLRPKIFIISYPDMEKVTTMNMPNNLSYIDVKLSDYLYLATLGQYPDHQLAFWDIRTGDCLASIPTYKKCSRYALDPIRAEVEVVLQYSAWHNQILIWELCRSSTSTNLKLVSSTDLPNNFLLSKAFVAVYFYNERYYVVNDYGEVFLVSVSEMTLTIVWSVPNKIYGPHSLFYSKNGLIVLNSEAIYFIKDLHIETDEWELEWMLRNEDGIVKAVADFNNNIHISTKNGNIYYIQNSDPNTVSLVPEIVSNCSVIDYQLLKGNKEEVILILVEGGDLRIVDLIRMNVISKYHINDAITISSHNTQPYIAVGTTTGIVYFLDYEKVRSPVEMAEIQVAESGIDRICLYDRSVFIKDELNGLHVMFNDYKLKNFKLKSSLEREPKEKWGVFDMFALDEWRAIVFLRQMEDKLENYAAEAWIYSWAHNNTNVNCVEFDLPHRYRSFTVMQLASTENIEFMGLRCDFETIDIFTVSKNTMNIGSSFKTVQFGNIACIVGKRNVLSVSSQCLAIHFRLHKKSKNLYAIARALVCSFELTTIVKGDECFNFKYLVVLSTDGRLKSYRLPILVDSLRENELINYPELDVIKPRNTGYKNLLDLKVVVVQEVPKGDEQIRNNLLQELRSIEKATNELIDYDLSVIGLNDMNFQKFCLNYKWLEMLKEESRVLCNIERNILLDAIDDQTRIRDWIFDLIKSKSTVFKTKLRSMFSGLFVESYSTRATTKELLDRFDLFRFYNMEPLEEELEELHHEDDSDEGMGEEEEEEVVRKALKRYVIEKGANVYEHVMAKDFELQDTNIVTFNQLYNEEAKQTIIITDALKAEFNKNFILSKNFKEETMDNVFMTNATLERIYSNMNCMLCLLQMDQFAPPQLSVPEWQKDENISKIIAVDDSELIAINRRKKAVVAAAHKSGRMLLWSVEFWKRALMIMMDGVLEKLWEEEIKKTPPLPEFMSKKQPHEYSLEDQKLFREYEQKLKLLEEDRKKYLRILRDNEAKTHALKKHFVMKLNEHIASIDQAKMKYDFAIRHERLRLLVMKLTDFKRIECKKNILKLRVELKKCNKYISIYEELLDFFERSRLECKESHEMQIARDRQLERQFKGNFLNLVPQHLTAEMTKIYKRRPKITQKIFSSYGICSEMSRRIISKKPSKFPLPSELVDFLNNLKTLDNKENSPDQLDLRHWDIFTKLRRQKIESEVRLRGIMHETHDATMGKSLFTVWVQNLKEFHDNITFSLTVAVEEYFDAVHNQQLELVLDLGQVEIHCRNGDLNTLKNCILMNVDDIVGVNTLIKEAGLKKLKAMQRVALFRRKVIFKEWQHKITRANIEYRKYILGLVQRCKVSYEFLEVLRNYDKLKDFKATTTKVGLIEEIVQQKINSEKKQLDRLDKRIDEIRQQLEEKKRQNREIDKRIDDLKVDVTYRTLARDFMGEERTERIIKARMSDAMEHGRLAAKVRSDYVKILELRTILDLTRWRTFETLPPVRAQCVPILEEKL